MRRRLPMAVGAVALAPLALFAALLVLGPEGTWLPRDLWLGNVAMAVPAVLCLIRAAAGGPHRVPALLFGIGALCFTFGNVAYVGWVQFDPDPAIPSVADVSLLALYPFASASVLLMVLRGRSFGAAIALDGALGATAAATALAVMLAPVLTGIEGDLREVLTTGSYPVGDLLLVSVLVGTLATRGRRGGAALTVLTGGLLLFLIADVTYALRVAAGVYELGTPLETLWPAGLTVMAAAFWVPPDRRASRDAGSAWLLGLPLASMVVGVGVLVWASQDRLPLVTVVLATATLVLAALRGFVAFREVEGLAEARRQARTDDLTGLLNRRALYERAALRLHDARPGERVALLLIDLDGFKEVNDALGHHVGDELLRRVAERLGRRLLPGDVLARLGGDEFALLVAEDDRSAQAVARGILDDLAQPVPVGGLTTRVGASVGIAVHPEDGDRLPVLLQHADIAMYEAKRRRSHVERYAAELDKHDAERVELLRDLSDALETGQFILHFQPKCDARSGRWVAVEALVRWQHPTRGLLLPGSFLGLIEQHGLMARLTQVVLTAAAERAAAWRAAGVGLPIAVNLSASDLLDEGLPGRVGELLARHALPPAALEVEITESVLMADPERALRTLAGLRTLGLVVAVDDFGTGYSSLTYLADLPVDQLKIDRHFVARITGDRRSAAIVRSTIELAHALNLEVVAEGVEDADALERLVAMGCEWAQGYHLGRPLPADELVRAHDRAATPVSAS